MEHDFVPGTIFKFKPQTKFQIIILIDSGEYLLYLENGYTFVVWLLN